MQISFIFKLLYVEFKGTVCVSLKQFTLIMMSLQKPQIFALCCVWKNWEFFTLKQNNFVIPSSNLVTLKTWAGRWGWREACDCVQCGGRRPVKWDVAPSIWAADLCTLADGINESPAPRLEGSLNLLPVGYSTGRGCLLLVNRTRLAHGLTQATLVFGKVARRKEFQTLMETVAKDNQRPP